MLITHHAGKSYLPEMLITHHALTETLCTWLMMLTTRIAPENKKYHEIYQTEIHNITIEEHN
jgi:hypothetical protein